MKRKEKLRQADNNKNKQQALKLKKLKWTQIERNN